MEPKNGTFEGWGRFEAMGHNSHIGYIATESFGIAVLFRIDTPELPERQVTLSRPEYDDEGRLLPIGSVVLRSEVPGQSVFYGAGSVYRIIPCTEEAARAAIESSAPRKVKLISLPPGKALPEPDPDDDEPTDDEWGTEEHPL